MTNALNDMQLYYDIWQHPDKFLSDLQTTYDSIKKVSNPELARSCLEKLFHLSIPATDKSFNVALPVMADNQIYTVVGIGSVTLSINPIMNTMKLYICIPLTTHYSIGYLTGIQLHLMDVIYNGTGVVHFIAGEHDGQLIKQMLRDMYE